MNTRTNHQAFAHDLAWGVAQDGAAAHEAEVTALVEMAVENGLVPAAAEVLADRTAPEVVRQRAFGLVTAALAALGAGQAQCAPVLVDAA
jgi:hypothetical protein